MKVEIHRENYQVYCECKVILDTQREILHKLSGKQAALSPPPPAIACNKWHTDSYDWGAMERSLFVGHTHRDDDVVEDEEEDEEEEERRKVKKMRRKRRRLKRIWRKMRMTTTLCVLLGHVASLFSLFGVSMPKGEKYF
jgi:hypothetical protein